MIGETRIEIGDSYGGNLGKSADIICEVKLMCRRMFRLSPSYPCVNSHLYLFQGTLY